MTRVRRPARGLRGRLVVALMATSIATLGVAALAVLPLLQQRLVADRLSDLRDLARTAGPALRAIPLDELHPQARAVVRLADHLEQRTGGRIVIYDDARIALADTAPERPGLTIADLTGARSRALARSDGVASGRRGPLAYAVTVVRSGDDRLTLVITKGLDDTRAAAAVVRAAVPLALASGLAVALGLALLLSRSLLGRLERLRDDARALGEEGLGHGISVSGGDEVAEVAHALEAMRVRLVEEEASRQAFVATASHELRTPLAALQATLELLREDVLHGRTDPRATAARADTALRQTHRLVGLATDLLDLSRVDGDVRLSLEPLEVADVARTVAREFEGSLGGAGRGIVVDGGPALAVADAAAVARVLRGLVDNAARYGAGTIAVHVGAVPGWVAITVADEGDGLAPGEREAVFVRFARGRAADRAPGSGLGLAIARGLARAMGGDVEALPGDGGARFAVTLPAWQGEPADALRHELRTAR